MHRWILCAILIGIATSSCAGFPGVAGGERSAKTTEATDQARQSIMYARDYGRYVLIGEYRRGWQIHRARAELEDHPVFGPKIRRDQIKPILNRFASWHGYQRLVEYQKRHPDALSDAEVTGYLASALARYRPGEARLEMYVELRERDPDHQFLERFSYLEEVLHAGLQNAERGDHALARKRLGEAIAAYEADELYLDDETAIEAYWKCALANLRLENPKPEEAADSLRRYVLVSEQSKTWFAFSRSVGLLEKAGHLDTALEFTDQLQPHLEQAGVELFRVYRTRASLLARSGAPVAEVEAAVEEMLAHSKHPLRRHYPAYRVLKRAGAAEKGVVYLEKLADEEPTRNSMRLLFRGYLDIGKKKAAVATMRRFVRLEPKASSYAEAAKWLRGARMPAEAKPFAISALRRDRANRDYAELLFELAVDTSDKRRMASSADVLFELTQDDPRQLQILGQRLQAEGLEKRAAKALWKSHRAKPSLPLAGRIAKLELRRGKRDRAVEAYELLAAPASIGPNLRIAKAVDATIDVGAALPFYAEAASTRYGAREAYFDALQRAGRQDMYEEAVLEEVKATKSNKHQLAQVAELIDIAELSSPTRREVIRTFEQAEHHSPAVIFTILEHYALGDDWEAAIGYLQKRAEASSRPFWLRLPQKVAPSRARAVMGGLTEAFDESIPSTSKATDDQLLLAALADLAFYDFARNKRRADMLDVETRTTNAARKYLGELVARASDDETIDWDFFLLIQRHRLYELAERYLTQRPPTEEDERRYWQSYARLLSSMGRLEALDHVQGRWYAGLKSADDRAKMARGMARSALERGDARHAERWFERYFAAMKLAGHGNIQPVVRAWNRYSTLLIDHGRIGPYLRRTAHFYADPPSTDAERRTIAASSAIRRLQAMGYHEEAIPRLELLADSPEEASTGRTDWRVPLAVAYAHVGKASSAVRTAEGFLGDSEAIFKVADTLEASGEPGHALALLEAMRSTRRFPFLPLLARRCALLMRLDRTDEALQLLSDVPKDSALQKPPKRGRDAKGLRILWRAAMRTGNQKVLLETLDKAVPAVADALRQHPAYLRYRLATASDLSFVKAQLSRPVPLDPVQQALVDFDLGWIATRHAVERTWPRNHGLYATPIVDDFDTVARLDLIDTVIKKRRAQLAPNRWTPLVNSLLGLQGRTQELRRMLATQGNNWGSWRLAASLSEYEKALEFAYYGERSHTLQPPIGAIYSIALINEETDPLLRAVSRRADVVPEGERRFLRTYAAIQRGEARKLFERTRRAIDAGHDGRAVRAPLALQDLMLLAGLGYDREASEILGMSNRQLVLDVDAARAVAFIGEEAWTPTSVQFLPPFPVRQLLTELVGLGEFDWSEKLLQSFRRGRFSRSRLETDDRIRIANSVARSGRVARYRLDRAVLHGLRPVDFNVLIRDALRANALDKLARIELSRAQLMYRRPSAAIATSLAALGRFDRVDELVGAAKHPDDTRAKIRGAIALGEPQAYLAELGRLHKVYPGDLRAEIDRLVIGLLSDPWGESKAHLGAFVRQHASEPVTISTLVRLLAEHDLHVELAAYLLPHVDIEELPVSTNRQLFDAALRTGRHQVADRLASLVASNSPEPAYLLADLASSALDEGAITLAKSLLRQSKAHSAIPFQYTVDARLALARGGDTSTAPAIALVANATLAPGDRCSLLHDALRHGHERLQKRLVRAMLRKPFENRNANAVVLAKPLRTVVDCFVAARRARRGLEVLATMYPKLDGEHLAVIAPHQAIEMGRLARHAGDLQRARATLRKAIVFAAYGRKHRAGARAWRELAEVALAQKRFEDALRFANWSIPVEGAADKAAALELKARVHRALGNSALSDQFNRLAYAATPSQDARNELWRRLISSSTR